MCYGGLLVSKVISAVSDDGSTSGEQLSFLEAAHI